MQLGGGYGAAEDFGEAPFNIGFPLGQWYVRGTALNHHLIDALRSRCDRSRRRPGCSGFLRLG
jgi:hypothetical protein